MSPQFVVSASDVERYVSAARGMRGLGSPVKLAAKLSGLGEGEWRAGIPTWAWVALAFGVGCYVGVAHVPTLQEKLGL